MNDFIEEIRRRHKVIKLTEGNIIKVDKNISMEVLSKSNAIIVDEQKDINNLSIVIRLDYNNSSFLFTGDIQEETENTLIDMEKNIKADVLKVPHHGSDTSSSEVFLAGVRPRISIISVGESNNFNHPNPDVVKLLEDISIRIYRTDKDGAVEVITNGDWIRVDITLIKNYAGGIKNNNDNILSIIKEFWRQLWIFFIYQRNTLKN